MWSITGQQGEDVERKCFEGWESCLPASDDEATGEVYAKPDLEPGTGARDCCST